MLLKKIVLATFLFFIAIGFSQKKETMNASMVTTAAYMRAIEPLAGKKLLPGKPREGEINPRRTDANKIVPGKGFPKGIDPLLVKQKSTQGMRSGKAPSLVFDVNSSNSAPSDPTGAIGPNHYVSAKNYAFAIHDRSGNELVASSSLANIFPGETLGDPIVFYDSFADRFVITQFSNTPNGFLVAVGQGPDPVNDGWYTYRFNTEGFPDYTKFSIWSDGYYVTANKDQNSIQTSEIVFVIEREKMLQGAEQENVKMVGFPLPGARIGGFYSPASFNALGKTLPPDGDARIIYFQDDEWEGVDQDVLKLWKINVDWIFPSQSTITEAEEIPVTPFDSTFDGGSFSNIPQPGTDGQDIDVLQGAVMFATNYRRFCDYNTVILNFAVDIDTVADNVAGIRWYELRQNGDGQPWIVFQEGTYTSPDGKSAWCASMAMDIYGNIGMGYTTMGTTSTGASADSFASIRYTGRLASDPLGTMTIAEQDIKIGTDIQRNGSERYGDYAQLTVDPIDDQTFWHIAEYFENTGDNSRNVVGVFKVAGAVTTDVGVVSIDTPGNDATFTNSENITVTVKNFGSTAQSNIQVTYSINGGPLVNELLAGPIAPLGTTSFSFATNADLSTERVYTITAETNAAGDTNPENDCSEVTLNNLLSVDVGIIGLISPTPDSGISTSSEAITIALYNYGFTTQTNIPVFYTLNNGTRVEEVYTGTLQPQTEARYTFTTLVDITGTGTFEFQLGTALATDENTANDTITRTIERTFCKPTANCTRFGDGIKSFELANVTNTQITCDTGYEDFANDFTINLNRSIGNYTLTVQTGFADNNGSERVSMWIDLNDNIVFEASELLVDNQIVETAETDQEFAISISADAILGKHLLRIRAGDVNTNSGDPLNNPCGSMDFGTTHDYTVEIVENKELDTGLIVITEPNNQFLITKSDSGSETEKKLYIFNILGQVIVSNIVRKDANGRFVYDLDMSYARSGVYFARFGNKRKADATRFVVQ
jgi:hypothetical protein